MDNARQMQQIAGAHGSFGAWLQAMVEGEGVDATAKELAKRFKYVSEKSAHRYLYAVGEDIGEVDDKIRRKYGPAD